MTISTDGTVNPDNAIAANSGYGINASSDPNITIAGNTIGLNAAGASSLVNRKCHQSRKYLRRDGRRHDGGDGNVVMPLQG